MIEGCVFCDYSGPSPILHNEDDILVFAPLNPVTEGHMLVVPRVHVTDASVDPVLAGRVMQTAASWVWWHGSEANIIVSIGASATQTVQHLHLHIVPRKPDDGLRLPWS